VLSDFGRGFDSELSLTYHEVTPDGARAQLEIHDRLLQPWGIVHGGVCCAIIESLSSVAGQT
jgi:acyl-coenzyme A thioesterase PaaI-like protein